MSVHQPWQDRDVAEIFDGAAIVLVDARDQIAVDGDDTADDRRTRDRDHPRCAIADHTEGRREGLRYVRLRSFFSAALRAAYWLSSPGRDVSPSARAVASSSTRGTAC